MAITDMSDNANKMGTAIESIRTAYAGFAKQNYTMLDNLKLGYGGTKEEMQRLLDDAEKFSGVDYDISNLNDVFEAIHVIQTEMGITGTTAKEAATTIQGSIGMLKGAWANLLIGLGRDDADLDKLFDNVVKSAKTAFDNIKPVARRALVGIGKLVGEIAPTIAEELPGLMEDLLPDLISGAEGLLGGLADALPDLLLTLLDNLPQLVDSVVTIAGKLFQGLAKAIPELLGGIWERIDTALSESGIGQEWNTLKQNVSGVVDDLKQKWEDLKTAAEPLTRAIGKIKDKFVEWVTSPEFQASVFSKITTAIDDVGTAIGLVMDGITFILDNAQAAWDALGGGASPAARAILSAFSPVTSLFSGLASKISGLFSGLSIPNFGSILGSLLGGQHAIGADYIPYNGYPAILHRGEAVLTAREADEWRRGQGKGAGVVNNFTFNGVSQSDLDYIVAYVNRGLA
jgi:phage-related protein